VHRTGARRVVAGIMAGAIAMIVAAPVRADDVSELRAEIRALSKRLADMEKAKAKADSERAQQAEREKAAAGAPGTGPVCTKAGLHNPFDDLFNGRPVHIYETSGTDVQLYGIIEGTLGWDTNADRAGHSTIGLNTSWFSGNRWGINITQQIFPESK